MNRFRKANWFSLDILLRESLPAALAPDQKYDKIDCFFGSTTEADGKHVLVCSPQNMKAEKYELIFLHDLVNGTL